jgi:hypothetical protein
MSIGGSRYGSGWNGFDSVNDVSVAGSGDVPGEESVHALMLRSGDAWRYKVLNDGCVGTMVKCAEACDVNIPRCIMKPD